MMQQDSMPKDDRNGAAAKDAAPGPLSANRPAPWRRWLERIACLVPSFQHRRLPFRLLISALLLGMLVGLPVVRFDGSFALLAAALRYNPVEYAQTLYDGGKKVAALDFIEFYLSIPGIDEDNRQALTQLRALIAQDRAAWAYRAAELWKGIKGEDSEEFYGKTAEFLTEFTPVGDVRALAAEGRKAARGEEVDALNASLATLSLGMTLAAYGPQAPAVLPLKPLTAVIKKCSVAMSPPLKKSILKAFDPMMSAMARAKPLMDDAATALSRGNVRKAAEVAQKTGGELAQHMKKGAQHFTDFVSLAGARPAAAVAVARYSDDVASLSKNSRLAASMGDDAGRILAYGGRQSLHAAEALQKGGALSGDALKGALRFGEAGLAWVRKLPLRSLIDQIRLVRTTLSGKLWYFFRYYLSLVPAFVVVLLMAGSGLVLLRMWCFPPPAVAPCDPPVVTPASPPEAKPRA